MSEAFDDSLDFEEDTLKDKYLTFSIGEECYGIEIRYVIEIIGIQPITEIPELPNYVKGIINLRGKIIPVIDVRLRFNKLYREYNDRTCIIVISVEDTIVGLIIDSVSDVISIQKESIVEPPSVSNSFNNKYISGIGKIGSEVKLLLDTSKLINSNELENITE
ncbi:chemotaxis protein CheW [Clostridium cellulovorans]|uniref:Chemotaxis protein CheW n=1 Tax=Clostridium cellulovorans (strain ATCC 35296 / DSM 3052 / OCM 3 / 743B) TaxID=573061 RepID=D9SQQ2_CLOC7|nr:chemotaxis protein CheW [Clostridium cellulovorans]ADL52258.1 CheW protein [Clostridium cellulovorans 743B]